MTESRRGRPRPRARIVLDPDNAYARLGVSPLASTDEIKALCNRKRREAAARARGQTGGAFGEADAAMEAVQRIEAQIGSPRARARYDRDHPQNELLTVQPGPRDRALEPARAAATLTAWLLEALGPEAPLPSPSALALWAPAGIPPDLAAALARFERPEAPPGAPGPEAPVEAPRPECLDALAAKRSPPSR